LLTLGERNSVPIVIATVPMSHSYSIDPTIPQLVESHHMTFIEANRIDGLDSTHFPDGYHIDESGAEKYTKRLAEEFAKIFESRPDFQKARKNSD
jgi:hypothetical protein